MTGYRSFTMIYLSAIVFAAVAIYLVYAIVDPERF
ncbi:MAG: potassium-transporting ATPase subunit F [Candidatus Hydrogenedentes bacterium]|nr:potassium-transporting ATPase subunit F [Candidatus Hydrogenedentota bacterium]